MQVFNHYSSHQEFFDYNMLVNNTQASNLKTRTYLSVVVPKIIFY